jgi:hypothetical protein
LPEVDDRNLSLKLQDEDDDTQKAATLRKAFNYTPRYFKPLSTESDII